MEGILARRSISVVCIFAAIFFFSISSADERRENPSVIELPDEAVSKKILDNGLVVLIQETSPQNLVAINVKIPAGSSLEEEYLGSGISHLVEHMVFKGGIEKEIKAMGGFINGSVTQDRTEYSIVVGRENAKRAIALLKNMLLNASFDSAEFDKEKEVILKELSLDNDEPQNLLARLLNQSAYLYHTYKYPPIGYKDKLIALKREDALKFYKRMYVPNGMVIAIVGGVDKDDIGPFIESEFTNFRKPDYAIRPAIPSEPAQIAKRYADKKIATNLSYMAIGYHSTSALDEDLFAMDVLSMILGRGDNSRLNSRLFKKDRLVHSVSCWNFTPRDPGLFVVTAVADPDKLKQVEKAIQEEISKVSLDGITDEELARAKRMVLGDFLFGLQAIDAQASELATNEMLTGSYDFARRYVRGVQAVTASDVRRVANKYLREDGASIARIVPENFTDANPKPKENIASDRNMKTLTLSNGVRIAIRQNKKTPTVSITAAFSGGLASENISNNGISEFVSRMLLKGTVTRKEEDIANALEKLGGGISSFNGFDGFGISADFLKDDFDTAISIFQDVLANSVFPDDEVEKERNHMLAMIREADEDIFQRGIDAFRRDLFGDSSYGLRLLGQAKSVKALKRADLVDFYKNHVIANNVVISVSGDVDPARTAEKLTKVFSSMKAGTMPKALVPPARLNEVKIKTIDMDREQSLIVMGFMTTDVKDKDKYALDIIGSVLSGYSGRLFGSLRQRLPIAYALGTIQKTMVSSGFFAFYVATAKDKISTTQKELLNQISTIRKNGISDEELLHAARELKTAHEIKLQTNDCFSQTTAIDELYGLGYDNVNKYGACVDKVTKEDVKAVVDKYFDLNAYTEIIVRGEK